MTDTEPNDEVYFISVDCMLTKMKWARICKLI